MSNYSDNAIVKIKPIAYYKMLLHVLRFGSKTRPRNQYKEVMGMLIGHLEGNNKIQDVIIEDAVPISHGGSIEVTFAPTDYVSFSLVDEKFAKKNWFTVGWYHSHPGLDIFFSSTDIRNQLGWQSANRSAIGMVFDHNYLEKPGDLGFRTFRLDDPNRGDLSNYHEVNTIVESPESLDFYDKMVKVIESIHTKEPPILEINEKPQIFGEIDFPNDNQLMVKIPDLDPIKITDTIKSGISGLIDTILNSLIIKFNKWIRNIGREIINLNLSMKEIQLRLKNTLGIKIEEIQNFLKNSLETNLNSLDYYIEDRFEVLDKNINNINNSIDSLEDKTKTELNNSLNIIKSELEEKLISLSKNSMTKIEDIENINSELSNKINKQKESLDELYKLSDSIQNKIINDLKDYYEEVQRQYKKEYKNSYENITNLAKRSKKINSNLEAFKINIKDQLESLKDRLNTLNNENQNLKKKLDESNVNKKNLEKQTEDLRNENIKLKQQIEKANKGE